MLAFAKAALLLLVFSLPFNKHGVMVGGLQATATEVLFLLVAAAFAGAVLKGETRPRWCSSLVAVAAYGAAILCALLVTATLAASAARFASQLYLLSLPVLGLALIDDLGELRRLSRVWLAATAVTATIGTVTVLLYVAGVDRAAIDYALHGFGTLAPGAYPRLESTFTHPAMLCNYLTVSLAILMICLHLRWIGRAAGYSLFAAILVTAAFTITPGIGGIAALLGLWLFLKLRERAPAAAVAALALGSALAVAFVAVSVVTPILHPTAPFLIQLPGIETPLAPAVRLMAWIEAAGSIRDHLLFGVGIGADPIVVDYVAPSGDRHVLTDAHNVYLNVAMHHGLVGLAALIALIVVVARAMRPLRLTDANAIRLGLGVAWLNAFAYQGLTGSYEDARHLWLLLGLLFVTIRIERQADRTAGP